MSTTPFTEPDLVTGPLYATAGRLARRTGALHAAKISGPNATRTIVDLAARVSPNAAVVCDIGCGRGSTTLALAARLAPDRLIAVDQSRALLDTVAERLEHAGRAVELLRADFHDLPLPDGSIDVAVAAFCLYHSPHPLHVLAEITRCLVPCGHVVLATKSLDSYREIDQLIIASGLDPNATTRPSLYQSFHSGTIAEISARVLRVDDVVSELHVFQFADLGHLAAYVATSPKYQLPERLTGDPDALAAALRHRILDRPVVVTSTVSYAVAVRP